MTPTACALPLFPLRTVLFPGGELSLRIFEPRYLRLIRDCARGQQAFGIALLLDSQTHAGETVTAKVGTSAKIIDFDTLPDGLLGIRVRGEARFRLQSVQCQDDGLVNARIDYLPDADVGPVRAEHLLLDSLLSTYWSTSAGHMRKWTSRLATIRTGSAIGSPNCCRWTTKPANRCCNWTARIPGWIR